MGGDDGLDALNQAIAKTFGQLFPSSPAYSYWEDKKKNRYCYTTEKVRNPKNGKAMWAAFIYRYYKTKKLLKLKKTVYFAKRKKAKARALKWLEKALSKEVD